MMYKVAYFYLSVSGVTQAGGGSREAWIARAIPSDARLILISMDHVW